MIAGVILAGGGGRRLGGVRKADLRLGNRPLWRHCHARLAPQVDTVLLSVAEGARPDGGDGIVVVPDAPDGVTGPAAGLFAAALWCAARAPYALLISVSVDTPFFPSDFAQRARPFLAPGIGCVVGAYDGRDYPVNALWSVPALVGALTGVARTPKGPRVRDIAARIGVAACAYDDLPANPFKGINALPDLLALSRAFRGDARRG